MADAERIDEVYQTCADVSEDRYGKTILLDTILWRGVLWLVPKWQRGRIEGFRQPTRIIRPRLYQFVRVSPAQMGEDYSLAVLIPKRVLDGQPSLEDAEMFDIVEAPPVETRIPTH
jgi:hypothetical protein